MKSKLAILGMIVAATLFVSTAKAGLVKVRFDNMSAANATQSYSYGAFTVARSASLSPGLGAPFNIPASNYVQNVGFNFNFGLSTVTYTLSSGTFGDLYDAYAGIAGSPFGTENPATGGTLDGFGFDIANFVNLSGLSEVTVLYGTGGPLTTLGTVNVNGNGFFSVRSDSASVISALQNATQIRFSVNALDSFTLTDTYAVPEASSLILVGLPIAGLYFGRRSRKAGRAA